MMSKLSNVLILCGFLFSFNSLLTAQEAITNQDGMFKPLHLIKIKSPEEEKELMTVVKDLNAAVAELGLKDVKYRLWKLRDDSKSEYTYIFESTWPDRMTYDKAHDSEAYKKVSKKWENKWESMFEKHEYGRYIPLN